VRVLPPQVNGKPRVSVDFLDNRGLGISPETMPQATKTGQIRYHAVWG
jgi:hypothetical protein